MLRARGTSTATARGSATTASEWYGLPAPSFGTLQPAMPGTWSRSIATLATISAAAKEGRGRRTTTTITAVATCARSSSLLTKPSVAGTRTGTASSATMHAKAAQTAASSGRCCQRGTEERIAGPLGQRTDETRDLLAVRRPVAVQHHHRDLADVIRDRRDDVGDGVRLGSRRDDQAHTLIHGR